MDAVLTVGIVGIVLVILGFVISRLAKKARAPGDRASGEAIGHGLVIFGILVVLVAIAALVYLKNGGDLSAINLI